MPSYQSGKILAEEFDHGRFVSTLMAVLGRKKYITGGQGDASAVFIQYFLHCPDKQGPYRELRQYNSEP